MTKDRVARLTRWQDTRFPNQGRAGKHGSLGSGALEGLFGTTFRPLRQRSPASLPVLKGNQMNHGLYTHGLCFQVTLASGYGQRNWDSTNSKEGDFVSSVLLENVENMHQTQRLAASLLSWLVPCPHGLLSNPL